MVSCINTTQHSYTWIRLSILFFLSISLSFSNAYDYCNALHDSLLFYEAQRSGKLPQNNRVVWRGDSALQDSTNANINGNNKDDKKSGNLEGGYYDAGDGMKFAFPLAFTTTTLSWGLIEFSEAVKRCGEYENYLSTIKWATDWMMKAHTNTTEFYGQVGDSETDHTHWQPPELLQSFSTVSRLYFNTTTNKTETIRETINLRPSFKIDREHPGSDLACEVAAAFASASIVFERVDAKYASKLRQHAREMHSFGYEYRGFYHDSIPDAASFYRSYGYEDEIVWSSTWLYLATRESKFLEMAKNDFQTWKQKFIFSGNTYDWDQKAPGVLVLLSLASGDPSLKVEAKRWMDSWKKGGEGEKEGRITYTPGGLAWVRRWGPLRYSSGSSFLSLFMSSADFARDQINYMLGSNPNGTSYLVGFGGNFPRNPRHRAAHASTNDDINYPVTNVHVLTGALVGGPGVNDQYTDSRDSISNEVSLDFNAAFTAALAGLASRDFFGDIPPALNFSGSPSASPTLSPVSTPNPTPPPPTEAPEPKWVQLEINYGSSLWWLAISFTYDEPVLDAEIMDAVAVSFVPMINTTWGVWEFYSGSSPLVLPLSFRVSFPSSMGIVSLSQFIPGASFYASIKFK